MTENDILQEDEISLLDFWERLREGWRIIVGGTALGIGGAVLAILLIPPKYESSTTFQIAKVAGNIIESPEIVGARISTPAFRLEVARKVGDEKLIERLTLDASNETWITTSMVKGTPIMVLTVKGHARDEARNLSAAVIEVLRLRHEQLGREMKAKIVTDIALNKEKLTVVEKELGELAKSATSILSVRDTQFAPVSLLTSMRAHKQSEVFNIRQQLSALELSLLPPITDMTKATEEPYIAVKPVSPKKGLLLALGTTGGLMIGLLMVFIGGAWRRAKAARELRSPA